MNPASCAAAAATILREAGLGDVPIGVVSGDDLLPRLDELQAAGCEFENLDDGRPLADLNQPIVSANAYLGAQPIADALAAGARIVITGRVADASLTVGPAMHEFGWSWTDWNKLAAASVAGHLIECGAQATGGYFAGWDGGESRRRRLPDRRARSRRHVRHHQAGRHAAAASRARRSPRNWSTRSATRGIT